MLPVFLLVMLAVVFILVAILEGWFKPANKDQDTGWIILATMFPEIFVWALLGVGLVATAVVHLLGY